MKRGLDVLLALEHADPSRVAVSGLSGGGWQTIFISSLDTRVTLSNPVAGYSSFRTRARHGMDLGDSEQTPVDLAGVADYDVLTMLRAAATDIADLQLRTTTAVSRLATRQRRSWTPRGRFINCSDAKTPCAGT